MTDDEYIKRLENVVAESERLLRMLLEAVPAPYVSKNLRMEVVKLFETHEMRGAQEGRLAELRKSKVNDG